MKAGRDLLGRVQKAFLDQGVSGLTMVAMARATGVTRRTLYNYFSSRDDAFRQAFYQFNLDLMEAAWQRGHTLQAEAASALDVIAAVIDTRYGNIWRVLQPSAYAAEIKGEVFRLCADQMIELAATFRADMVRLVEDLIETGHFRLKSGVTPARLIQMLTDATRGINHIYPIADLTQLYGYYRDTCQAVLYGYVIDTEKG